MVAAQSKGARARRDYIKFLENRFPCQRPETGKDAAALCKRGEELRCEELDDDDDVTRARARARSPTRTQEGDGGWGREEVKVSLW